MFKRTFIFAAAMLGMLAFTPLTTWAQDEAVETTEAPAKAKAKKKKKKACQPRGHGGEEGQEGERPPE